jgi:predicted transposase/invertase (TIGR01784 family)
LTISKDETAALQAMSREKFILDRQSDLIRAKREGRQEGIKEIAKEMLKKHIDTFLISELTGLSIEEINKLKNIY